MPGTGQKPDSGARGVRAGSAGPGSIPSIATSPPGALLAGPPIPAAPVGPVASRDLPEPPPPAPFSRGAPLSAGAIAGTDLPPPADYTGPPPYTGGPVNAPLATPPALSGGFTPESGMPASPNERIQTGLATPQDPALQQALGPRPPLIAEDRATRERAPLTAPPAGVPQTPLRWPAPMPGVDMGQAPPAAAVQPTPVTTTSLRPGPQTLQPPGEKLAPTPAPLITPAPAPAAVPPAPAAPVSTMRDVARAARGTGVDYIYRDPGTNILSGFDDKNPWTPEQQAQIAGAVPGIVTGAGGLTPYPCRRPPLVAPAADCAAAAAPPGAPLVTPRTNGNASDPCVAGAREQPSPATAHVCPSIEPVTLGPAAPETAGMGTPAPLIAPPATTPINPRLSPKRDRATGRRSRLRHCREPHRRHGGPEASGQAYGSGGGLATGNPLLAGRHSACRAIGAATMCAGLT